MKQIRPGLIFCLLAYAILVSSCATAPPGFHASRNFTADKLYGGKLIFAGLTTNLAGIDQGQLSSYAKIAKRTLSRQRFDLGLNYMDYLNRTPLPVALQKIRDRFNKGDKLSQEDISQFKTARNSYRYILLARITQDQVKQKQEQKSTVLENGVTKFEDIYATLRKTGIYTEIYDNDTAERVWYGELVKEDTQSTVLSNDSTSNALVRFVSSSIDKALHGKYPEPTSMEKMIELLFTDFAQALPLKY